MRFGISNDRSLYRSDSRTSVSRELARYTLDSVSVYEVRWDKGSTLRTWYYIFVYHRILSAVKRVEFVSDRMSHIFLKGRWCSIIVLNVHEPSEEKRYESKDSFIRN
jgi:hypothetical protein